MEGGRNLEWWSVGKGMGKAEMSLPHFIYVISLLNIPHSEFRYYSSGITESNSPRCKRGPASKLLIPLCVSRKTLLFMNDNHFTTKKII